MDTANPSLSRGKARIAGWLYLVTTVLGAGSDLIRAPMILRTDAAATAQRILAAEPLYRATIAAEFLAGACYIGVTAILYTLLKPVNRTAALAAAFFSVAGCAVGAAALCLAILPLVLLGGAPYLAAFSNDQLAVLSLVAIKAYGQGYNIGMLFFGLYRLSIGALLFRSTDFPRWLGVLVALAGAAWLTDSFADILSPAFDRLLDPWIEAPGFIGEMALCLWLIVGGVDSSRSLAARSSQTRHAT